MSLEKISDQKDFELPIQSCQEAAQNAVTLSSRAPIPDENALNLEQCAIELNVMLARRVHSTPSPLIARVMQWFAIMRSSASVSSGIAFGNHFMHIFPVLKFGELVNVS